MKILILSKFLMKVLKVKNVQIIKVGVLQLLQKKSLVHACLCVPDFGISTEPGIDLKL